MNFHVMVQFRSWVFYSVTEVSQLYTLLLAKVFVKELVNCYTSIIVYVYILCWCHGGIGSLEPFTVPTHSKSHLWAFGLLVLPYIGVGHTHNDMAPFARNKRQTHLVISYIRL